MLLKKDKSWKNKLTISFDLERKYFNKTTFLIQEKNSEIENAINQMCRSWRWVRGSVFLNLNMKQSVIGRWINWKLFYNFPNMKNCRKNLYAHHVRNRCISWGKLILFYYLCDTVLGSIKMLKICAILFLCCF